MGKSCRYLVADTLLNLWWRLHPRLKCQRLRSPPTRNLICLFVVKLLLLWKENQIKAHRFHVFKGSLHSTTVINHPNSTSRFLLCSHHCLRVHVHIHEWDEPSKNKPDACFYGKICCKRHAQTYIQKSAGYRYGHVVVGISTLIQMWRCVIRKVLLLKPTQTIDWEEEEDEEVAGGDTEGHWDATGKCFQMQRPSHSWIL